MCHENGSQSTRRSSCREINTSRGPESGVRRCSSPRADRSLWQVGSNVCSQILLKCNSKCCAPLSLQSPGKMLLLGAGKGEPPPHEVWIPLSTLFQKHLRVSHCEVALTAVVLKRLESRGLDPTSPKPAHVPFPWMARLVQTHPCCPSPRCPQLGGQQDEEHVLVAPWSQPLGSEETTVSPR